MLEAMAVTLIIFWIIAVLSAYSMGGLVHLLLIMAIISVLVSVIRDNRL